MWCARTGAEFEAEESFAGLSHVLHPFLEDGLARLSPLHRQALDVALGLDVGTPADRLVTGNAVLALLRDAAERRPLLIVVDDLPWLDRASSLVLASAVRRLTGTRVGFLAALRTEAQSFFDRAGLPSYELGPLDDDAAASLLSHRFPALTWRVRKRLIADAKGNPLALLELPIALRESEPARHGLGDLLPLTVRLEDLFASRIRNLPAPTTHLLLIAVLDGTGDLRVLEAVASEGSGLDALAPAEHAGIISVDNSKARLTFRHPLIRSAVVALSTSDQRRRGHKLLAECVTVRERRAWHLAEATVAADESVASILEEAARLHLNRGDAVRSVAEMSRAAELSPLLADRGRRMAEAVYIGANFLGELVDAPDLLDAVRESDPEHAGSLAGAMAAAYHLLNGAGDVATAHQLLVGAIETTADPGDASDEVLVEAIYNLLEICHYGGRPELWEPFDRAVARLEPGPPEPLALLAAIASDPARRALPMLDRLESAIARLTPQSSPTEVIRLCIATAPGERVALCRSVLQRLVEQGRNGGTIAYSIQALVLLTRDAYLVGQWDEAQELADEGVRLCDSHNHVLLRWPHRAQQALLSAARGDRGTTQTLTDEILQWAVPRQAVQMQVRALHARELDSLGAGDFERAYQDLVEISPAGTIAPFLPHAMWVVMDLVEAAVRTGRHDEAVAHVAAAREAGIGRISPRLALLTEGAAGIAARNSMDPSRERSPSPMPRRGRSIGRASNSPLASVSAGPERPRRLVST